MHCHMFCPLGKLHSTCIKTFYNRDIGQNMDHVPPISSHLPSFCLLFQGTKACSAAPRQKTRPPKTTAPLRPSFETQKSMTGGKATTAAPTPKIMVIRLSWRIWRSGACWNVDRLLVGDAIFFGEMREIGEGMFDVWRRYGEVINEVLGWNMLKHVETKNQDGWVQDQVREPVKIGTNIRQQQEIWNVLNRRDVFFVA